jgi:Spy/CpxP family protein refolding chaperone
MKQLVALLLMTAAMAWSQPAFEDDDNFPPPGDRGRMMGQLKLTDDQEQKIDNLNAEFQKRQIAARAQLQSLRVDLRQLFKAERPDRNRIEGKMKDVEKLAGDIRIARVGHWFDIYAMLTPEQQKIWKDRPMKGRMERGRMMMKRRMPRGRGDDERPMSPENRNE